MRLPTAIVVSTAIGSLGAVLWHLPPDLALRGLFYTLLAAVIICIGIGLPRRE